MRSTIIKIPIINLLRGYKQPGKHQHMKMCLIDCKQLNDQVSAQPNLFPNWYKIINKNHQLSIGTLHNSIALSNNINILSVDSLWLSIIGKFETGLNLATRKSHFAPV